MIAVIALLSLFAAFPPFIKHELSQELVSFVSSLTSEDLGQNIGVSLEVELLLQRRVFLLLNYLIVRFVILSLLYEKVIVAGVSLGLHLLLELSLEPGLLLSDGLLALLLEKLLLVRVRLSILNFLQRVVSENVFVCNFLCLLFLGLLVSFEV